MKLRGEKGTGRSPEIIWGSQNMSIFWKLNSTFKGNDFLLTQPWPSPAQWWSSTYWLLDQKNGALWKEFWTWTQVTGSKSRSCLSRCGPGWIGYFTALNPAIQMGGALYNTCYTLVLLDKHCGIIKAALGPGWRKYWTESQKYFLLFPDSLRAVWPLANLSTSLKLFLCL